MALDALQDVTQTTGYSMFLNCLLPQAQQYLSSEKWEFRYGFFSAINSILEIGKHVIEKRVKELFPPLIPFVQDENKMVRNGSLQFVHDVFKYYEDARFELADNTIKSISIGLNDSIERNKAVACDTLSLFVCWCNRKLLTPYTKPLLELLLKVTPTVQNLTALSSILCALSNIVLKCTDDVIPYSNALGQIIAEVLKQQKDFCDIEEAEVVGRSVEFLSILAMRLVWLTS